MTKTAKQLGQATVSTGLHAGESSGIAQLNVSANNPASTRFMLKKMA